MCVLYLKSKAYITILLSGCDNFYDVQLKVIPTINMIASLQWLLPEQVQQAKPLSVHDN